MSSCFFCGLDDCALCESCGLVGVCNKHAQIHRPEQVSFQFVFFECINTYSINYYYCYYSIQKMKRVIVLKKVEFFYDAVCSFLNDPLLFSLYCNISGSRYM